MAITNTATAFTAFYATGDRTPAIRYNRSLAAGTTVIVAYGASVLDATASYTLSSVSDTAGNVYTVSANGGTANTGSVPYGAAGIAFCRLSKPVTTATTITFTLNTAHHCSFIGYAATGTAATSSGSAWTGRQEGTNASATVSSTTAPAMVYVAVNYFRDYNFASTPTAYGTGTSVLGFLDSHAKMALGLVARAASNANTGYQAGLTYSASLPYTAKGLALGEYVAPATATTLMGSQVITMF